MWEQLYCDLVERKHKLSVIGMGYVGMPIAVAFSKKLDVIGFDINRKKIEAYQSGNDPTQEVGDEAIRASSVSFTFDEKELCESRFHIVAVPTPINNDRTPNLRPVEGASETVGRNLKRGSVVVYESTVYPGVTEEICVPILERESGLKCGEDFVVGYSPERINPGDKLHRLESITKIVSGMNEESLEVIAKVYELVVEAGVYKAQNIKVAEAAKVIENSQRDINIAFMNELSIIFDIMGIDTKEVLKAAGTKWNFLNFYPGLVGGHCIGVDPYYLTYKADMLGYHSEVILAGRRINDNMGAYIANICVKKLIAADRYVRKARIAILGFTFKENCPDIRNSKVYDIVKELREFDTDIIVCDAEADKEETEQLYGIKLVDIDEVRDVDAVIIAVGHDAYQNLNINSFKSMYRGGTKVLIDVKGIYKKEDFEEDGYIYWRL